MRTISIAVLLGIVIAIPLTVYVVQQSLDIRQYANAFQLRSIDVNACGEIISQPAGGASSGDIVFKAPVKAADGTWQTVKQDGSIKTEAQIRDAFLGDPRNGGTETERQQNLQSAIGTNHINCNVFINAANNADCDVTFQTQLPNGSDAGKLPAGGTTTLRLTAGTNSGSGCRKLIKIENTNGSAPTATPTTATTTPTTAPLTPTTVTVSTTPTVTPTSTLTPTPTITPTPTLTPTPTAIPTPTVTPTPSIPATPTLFSVSVRMPGIGRNGNSSPNNALKSMVFQLFTQANQKIGSDIREDLSFDPGSGTFKGEVNAGTVVPSGSYTIKVKLDQSLRKAASNSAVTAGGTNTVPELALISGDINNDNKLDILDYNILASCFGGKINSEECGGKKVDADLNDDAQIDGVDYNLFVTGIKTAKQGD